MAGWSKFILKLIFICQSLRTPTEVFAVTWLIRLVLWTVWVSTDHLWRTFPRLSWAICVAPVRLRQLCSLFRISSTSVYVSLCQHSVLFDLSIAGILSHLSYWLTRSLSSVIKEMHLDESTDRIFTIKTTACTVKSFYLEKQYCRCIGTTLVNV